MIDPKISERIKGHGLILYDGECGFCQFWVQFIIKKDSRGFFLFAPLQAEWTKSLQDPKMSSGFDSILFFDGNHVYQKSGAVFRISGHMDGMWKLAKLLILLPPSFTDWFYDLIAKHRHQLSNTCEIPTPEEHRRFLNDDFI